MKKYFTLPGTRYYLGKDFIHPGMKVHLYKEPENAYDKEAIRVECEGLGKIGYVANSVYTVIWESLSAGRLYDRIDKHAKAEVIAVTDCGILCAVKKKESSFAQWRYKGCLVYVAAAGRRTGIRSIYRKQFRAFHQSALSGCAFQSELIFTDRKQPGNAYFRVAII